MSIDYSKRPKTTRAEIAAYRKAWTRYWNSGRDGRPPDPPPWLEGQKAATIRRSIAKRGEPPIVKRLRANRKRLVAQLLKLKGRIHKLQSEAGGIQTQLDSIESQSAGMKAIHDPMSGSWK